MHKKGRQIEKNVFAQKRKELFDVVQMCALALMAFADRQTLLEKYTNTTLKASLVQWAWERNLSFFSSSESLLKTHIQREQHWLFSRQQLKSSSSFWLFLALSCSVMFQANKAFSCCFYTRKQQLEERIEQKKRARSSLHSNRTQSDKELFLLKTCHRKLEKKAQARPTTTTFSNFSSFLLSAPSLRVYCFSVSSQHFSLSQ